MTHFSLVHKYIPGLKIVRTLFIFLLSGLLFACNTLKPYYGPAYRDWEEYELPDSTGLLHTVYLAGDGGDMEEGADIIRVMNRMLRQEKDSASTVVFLGDNIYLYGLPAPGEEDREEKEAIIRAQMKVADGYTGNVLFVPGNHDWDYSGPDGLARAIYQEQFVEDYFDGANVFRPDNGCAGPEVMHVDDRVVVLAINTEWWIHPYRVPRAPENGCLTEDKTDFMIRLASIVRTYSDRHILIAGHHPVISNGNHGGHYNILDHIFPLRLVRDNLYIPLPVIGSIYPVARKLGVTPQDIPNAEFQRFKQALLSIISPMPNVIYATGHDHNLQLNEPGEMHHVISGSASKLNFAIRGFGADYVHQAIGFARVMYYESGESWIEYFIVDKENPDGKLTFRKPLYALSDGKQAPASVSYPAYDSIHTAPAAKWERRSLPGEWLYGNGRIDEWIMPVEAPVFQPDTVVRSENFEIRGARNFMTLRVTDRRGNRVMLRPVEKFSRQSLYPGLRNTWLASEVGAQSRAHHPYGNLVVTALSDSLGLPAPERQLVYVPVSPALGQYIDEFGGILATVEPDSMRASAELISTREMRQRMEEDPRTKVNARLYLKTRFLDILSGDWNRTENDWLWMSHEENGSKQLIPVSRDHDQLFPVYDGFVPWLLAKNWNEEPLQSYGDSIESIQAFTSKNAVLDQRILSELTWSDWQSVIREFKEALADDAIPAAVRMLPKEVYTGSGEELTDQIRSRRNDLEGYARRFYEIIASPLEIVGTDHDDIFRLVKVDEKYYRITVTSDSITVFDRLLTTQDTREVRLYGLSGSDRFVLEENPVNIRIDPGPGEDKLQTSGEGIVHVYGNLIVEGADNMQVRYQESESRGTYTQDMENDYTGVTLPFVAFGYNPDDDLQVRIGMSLRRPGFRKQPAAFTAEGDLHFATATQAFGIGVEAGWLSLFGSHKDLIIRAGLDAPFVFNYFGEGNGTINERPVDYYRVPLRKGLIRIDYRHRLSPSLHYRAGIGYAGYDILPPEASENILDEFSGSPFHDTRNASFVQLGGDIGLRVTDRQYNPEKGFDFKAGATWNRQVDNGDGDFVNMYGNLSVYITPNLPLRPTLAVRAGFEHNEGEYYFYQSAFLGGLSNLRGYRRTRFAGETMFYLNNEIRARLFNFRNELLSGQMGLIGFFDLGKVWDRERRSGDYHHGYGGGAYLQFLDKYIWRVSAGFSEEDNYLVIGTGFLF